MPHASRLGNDYLSYYYLLFSIAIEIFLKWPRRTCLFELKMGIFIFKRLVKEVDVVKGDTKDLCISLRDELRRMKDAKGKIKGEM